MGGAEADTVFTGSREDLREDDTGFANTAVDLGGSDEYLPALDAEAAAFIANGGKPPARAPAKPKQYVPRPERPSEAPPPGALLSAILPGLGQWRQARFGTGLIQFCAWSFILVGLVFPALLSGLRPWALASGAVVLVALAVVHAISSWDAWRMVPRRG
jgi:hypothetical protein